jgi:hypothetical protein
MENRETNEFNHTLSAAGIKHLQIVEGNLPLIAEVIMPFTWTTFDQIFVMP